MDKILLVPIFVPLIAGFVLLFLPERIRLISKSATLLISALAFVLSIWVFNNRGLEYAWSVFQIDKKLRDAQTDKPRTSMSDEIQDLQHQRDVVKLKMEIEEHLDPIKQEKEYSKSLT